MPAHSPGRSAVISRTVRATVPIRRHSLSTVLPGGVAPQHGMPSTGPSSAPDCTLNFLPYLSSKDSARLMSSIEWPRVQLRRRRSSPNFTPGYVIGTALLQVLQNLVNLLGIPSSLNFAVMGAVVLIGVMADQLLQRRSAKALR